MKRFLHSYKIADKKILICVQFKLTINVLYLYTEVCTYFVFNRFLSDWFLIVFNLCNIAVIQTSLACTCSWIVSITTSDEVGVATQAHQCTFGGNKI